MEILCIRKSHSGASVHHITGCCPMTFLLIQYATLNATDQSFHRSNRKCGKKQRI